MTDNEIWKPIKGYGGLYTISNTGKVYSLRKKKVISASINNRGYMMVILYVKNKYKHFLIHRLVADAFVSNPMGLKEVNHKDEDKLNNSLGI